MLKYYLMCLPFVFLCAVVAYLVPEVREAIAALIVGMSAFLFAVGLANILDT